MEALQILTSVQQRILECITKKSDSGSSVSNDVEVRVLLTAPYLQPKLFLRKGFLFFVCRKNIHLILI